MKGPRIHTFEELVEAVRCRRSVVIGGQRTPASFVFHMQGASIARYLRWGLYWWVRADTPRLMAPTEISIGARVRYSAKEWRGATVRPTYIVVGEAPQGAFYLEESGRPWVPLRLVESHQLKLWNKEMETR